MFTTVPYAKKTVVPYRTTAQKTGLVPNFFLSFTMFTNFNHQYSLKATLFESFGVSTECANLNSKFDVDRQIYHACSDVQYQTNIDIRC